MRSEPELPVSTQGRLGTSESIEVSKWRVICSFDGKTERDGI